MNMLTYITIIFGSSLILFYKKISLGIFVIFSALGCRYSTFLANRIYNTLYNLFHWKNLFMGTIILVLSISFPETFLIAFIGVLFSSLLFYAVDESGLFNKFF